MTTRFTLTDDMVLMAVNKVRNTSSIYIADELRREQIRHVRRGGGIGNQPTAPQVLRHLKQLESKDLVQRVGRLPSGYYGYTWEITSKGLEQIAHIEAADKQGEI